MTFRLEFDNVNDAEGREYEIEVIWDDAVYISESEGYLSGLYYLIL